MHLILTFSAEPYTIGLMESAFDRCSGAVCGHLCGQKRFPSGTGDFSPVPDGKRFAFQVGWIVTLRTGLFKCFLRGVKLRFCGAKIKEM